MTRHKAVTPPAARVERRPDRVYQDISEAWVQLSELYEELGRAISEERRAQGYSQRALAELTGLTLSQVGGYEIGRRWKMDPPGIERVVLFLTTGRRFAPMAWHGTRQPRRRKAREL